MQNYVITITRQFGSGGRDIALAVAKELGIPMYDRSNIEKEAQAMDESLCSLVQLTERASPATTRWHIRWAWAAA